MKKWLFWGTVIVLLCILPWSLKDYTLFVLSLSLVYSIMAIGLNITLGYAGQISLCHAAFMGIGAYTTAIMITHGWSFWLSLPLAGFLACFFGALIGFPALKWKDHYLALVTLAFNIISFLVMQHEKWLTGGPTGITNIPRPSIGPLKLASAVNYYYLLLFFVILAILSSYWIIRSKWGRAFTAIRQNELAAKSHGVNLRQYKLLAFAIGAFYAGIGGSLFASLLKYINPEAFTFFVSFEFLIMVVIGGMGRIEGPIIGALIITMGPEILRVAESFYLIIYSLILILVMLFMRKGFVGVVDRIREWIPALARTNR